jgi:hypothetical protein
MSFFAIFLEKMSHNLPAVWNVLARPRSCAASGYARSVMKFIECVACGHTAKKAMRSIAAGQNVAEKNRTKAVGRLRFFVARAAVGGEA